jgi:archaellum biogenesis protein FlaJ (TadC family)
MAPLQKRAWWGLGVGLAFAIAFVLVFVLMGGIRTFDADPTFRLTIDALLIGALIANGVIVNIPLRNPKIVDERDIRIVERAPRIQWLAVVFTLVAWVIALTEAYHETRLIPAVYLYVMFMSVMIVSTLAQCLGIVLGYWRANRYG